MSDKVKLGRRARRRIIAVLAGLTVAGAVALMPIPTASASTLSLVNGPAGKNVTTPAKKTPVHAVRTTAPVPVPGSYGPAFQPSGSQGAPSPSPGALTPHIVGGELANSADFPGVVGIQSRFWNSTDLNWYIVTCTGTVISRTKVLTAGHCVTDLPFGTTWVIAGRNNLNVASGGFIARVSSTWTHQGFNLAQLKSGAVSVPIDDVSVLTLKDPLPVVYTPVTLSAQGDQRPYAADTPATIAGYGVTAPGLHDSGILHKAIVPMRGNATCAATYAAYDANRMVCAGSPATGTDSCHGDSGGPIFVNGVQVGITDWGTDPCASLYGVYERLSFYANSIAQDINRPTLVNLDWTGDGHSDLFSRGLDGQLTQWTGSGFANDGNGGFAGGASEGGGWQVYNKLFRVANWNGDGRPSIMARDTLGRLYQYRGTGEGFFQDGGPVLVGNGWNMFTDIMAVNNWNGDGRPNLMGRTLLGELYLYTSDGAGGWMNGGVGILIGTGWNLFNTVLTPGPWSGDGHQALIGRTLLGALLLYTSDGDGGWLNDGVGIQIGTGWNAFTSFLSPGDWNGDNMIDLVGVQPNGVVKLYKTNGTGAWLDGGAGQQIGTGWNLFNTVF